MIETKTNPEITCDGLPYITRYSNKGRDYNILGRWETERNMHILFEHIEPNSFMFKLQIIDVINKDEIWVTECHDSNVYPFSKLEAELPDRINVIYDRLVKKAKEEYPAFFGRAGIRHRRKYPKTHGPEFVTVKCFICGKEFQRKRILVELAKRQNYKHTVCGGVCQRFFVREMLPIIRRREGTYEKNNRPVLV